MTPAITGGDCVVEAAASHRGGDRGYCAAAHAQQIMPGLRELEERRGGQALGECLDGGEGATCVAGAV